MPASASWLTVPALLQIGQWLLVLLGHLAIACMLFNIAHANSIPRSNPLFGRKFSERAILAFALIPIGLFICQWCVAPAADFGFWSQILAGYETLCVAVAVAYLIRWMYRRSTAAMPAAVTIHSSETIDIQALHSERLLAGRRARLLGLLPFNQVTRLQIQRRQFRLPRLPTDLSGFTICQLSDLHFTGLVSQDYFQSVVDLANQEQPDLTIITGDIIDSNDCLDWIGKVLSRLTAPHGVFYVLGNHDRLLTDQQLLRCRLDQAGLIQAANGTWHCRRVGDANLLIAGNELPWYDQALLLPRDRPKLDNAFSLLLAHSPDQIGWAVHRNFDLMFAGHTHGGQIRLPVAGPVIAPSRYGIKYASGTFHTRDTLMHVSRGISSDEPIRVNCLPELGIFRLLKHQQGLNQRPG